MHDIVLASDDPTISASVASQLRQTGVNIRPASSVLAALRLVAQQSPDVAVLDVHSLDEHSAMVVLMVQTVCTGRIIVTAATRHEDGERSLRQAGIHDVVTKPCPPGKLAGRILDAARHGTSGRGATVVVGDLVVDRERRTVKKNGTAIRLNRREFDVLACLAARPGQLVSRAELVRAAWGSDTSANRGVMAASISKLRGKLGESAATPCYLYSLYGQGMILRAPAG